MTNASLGVREPATINPRAAFTGAASPLASLRLSPADEGDVRWLFCEASGDMGLRSSLGPMIDRLRLGSRAHRGSVPMGSVEGAEGPGEHAVAAVERWRRVAGRLGKLSRCDQRTFEAFYGVGLPRRQVLALGDLGAWAALVLLTAEREGIGRRDVASACAGAKGQAGAKGRVLLSAMKRAAEAALARACRAYRETR